MESPSRNYDINIMIEAIKKVQNSINSKHFATFSEIDAEISQILVAYEALGDGFERLRLHLTADAASSSDLKKSIDDMNLRCQERLKACECSQQNQINDILPFIRSTSRVLVHGSGMLLAQTIACALEEKEGAHFYLCEGLPETAECPEGSGKALLNSVYDILQQTGFIKDPSCAITIIPDSGVGALMTNIDFVVTGAYCVTEHGGMVHSTGSLQIAIVAQAMNVPCYVLCETFKFAHIFPLSTSDLKQPNHQENTSNNQKKDCDAPAIVPRIEFVPPSMITLIFSEKGIMPPSAVTDEMFQFHTARFAPWKRKVNG